MKKKERRGTFFEKWKMNEFLLTRWKILNMYDADELYMVDRKIYINLLRNSFREKRPSQNNTRKLRREAMKERTNLCFLSIKKDLAEKAIEYIIVRVFCCCEKRLYGTKRSRCSRLSIIVKGHEIGSFSSHTFYTIA